MAVLLGEHDRTMLAERGTPALLGQHLDSSYRLYPHIRYLSQKAVECIHGKNRRLLVSIQPQIGKSELLARRLPLWMLDWNPRKKVIIGSYSADLAHGHGRWIRNAILNNPDKLRVRLSPDSRAANRWNTPQGGGLLASGVGGSATGFGASVVVIDDPFSSWEEAQSPVIQEAVYSWYHTVMRTRLQAGGAVICIQTRWSEGDLIGRLLEDDRTGIGEGWEHVRIPAIADHDVEAGEVDPLGRAPGEPVCPELHPLEEVLAAMRAATPRLASGLYQQHPAPPEGTMFPREAWIELDEGETIPDRGRLTGIVRYWDLAATEGGGDWTAGVLLGRHRDGRTFVLDVVRVQRSAARVKDLVYSTALWDREHFGRRVAIRLEQEPGASGKSLADTFVEDVLGDFPGTKAIPSTGSKVVRAMSWASCVCDNRAILAPVRPDWSLDDFVAEHSAFGGGQGRHDDQVDAAAGAYNALREVCRYSKGIRMVRSSHLELVEDLG